MLNKTGGKRKKRFGDFYSFFFILQKKFFFSKYLNEGENGPRVRDLASDATRSTLLVISPEHAEVEVNHLKDFDGLRPLRGKFYLYTVKKG